MNGIHEFLTHLKAADTTSNEYHPVLANQSSISDPKAQCSISYFTLQKSRQYMYLRLDDMRITMNRSAKHRQVATWSVFRISYILKSAK